MAFAEWNAVAPDSAATQWKLPIKIFKKPPCASEGFFDILCPRSPKADNDL